jgi:hypothetical protein
MQRKISWQSVVRVATPTPESSWALLKATFAFWALFGLLWISWQFWGDGAALRRVLAVLLTLVALIRALDAVALMRKKRQRE